jgi:hypothetical protein
VYAIDKNFSFEIFFFFVAKFFDDSVTLREAGIYNGAFLILCSETGPIPVIRGYYLIFV